MSNPKSSIANRQAQFAASINLDDDDAPASQPSAIREPRTAPGQLMSLQAQLREAHTLIAQLRQGASAGQVVDLPLSDIYKVPGRQRVLSPQERAELKANLANNPLGNPIVVLPRNERGHELFAGHNRLDLYGELGRLTIPAIIRDFDAEKANVLAFYVNLLAPDLPDYAKYVGLKSRQEETGFNQAQLSDESGLVPQSVSLLFNFERLPAAARQILDVSPHILGATAAKKLADAADKGKADRVVEALELLAASTKEDRFTEENAVRYANGSQKPAKQTATANESTVRKGAKNFCKITPRANQVTFKFADEETSLVWAKKFEEFLRAELKKSDD